MKVFLSIAGLVLVWGLSAPLLSAQQKDTAAGEHIFSANCAACHGADGRGGERAPDIATRRNVVSLSDNDLLTIVSKGVSSVGMPPFGYLGTQKVNDVVAYLRVLQGKVTVEKITGDPKAGHALFFGKAECSKCHMMNGEGGFIATDLSDFGSGISLARLKQAIVAPNEHLEPTSRVAEIRTLSGQRISGLVRSEDNFSITLQTEDGRFHMYSKSKLASVRHTSHSIMPDDYGTKLSSKELEDLTSYLVTASKPAANQLSSKGKRKHDAD